MKNNNSLSEDIDITSLTQNIEDFNTPDITEIVKTEKAESQNSASHTMDGITADDFLDIENNETKVNNTNVKLQNKKDWMNVVQPAQQCVDYDSTSLPLCTLEDGSKALRFYWWDAWEDRFVKPGVVFLFGKVYIDHSNPSSGCISCCLCVKNVNRKLYLLPREYVSFIEIFGLFFFFLFS